MKNDLLFDFEIDNAAHTIKVKRTFAASLPLVWDAWTKAEILDQWWAPEGWKSDTKTMQFKEGGMRHYLMQGPEKIEMWGITSYNKIQRHVGFSGNEYSADEEAVISPELPPSNYHINFFEEGDTTIIEHNTTYKSLEALKQSIDYGFEEGMLGAFKRLDSFLEKS